MSKLIIEKEVNDNEDIIIHSYELKKLKPKNYKQKYKIIIISNNKFDSDNYKKKNQENDREKALDNILKMSETSKLKLTKEYVTREDAHKRYDF